MTNQYHILNGDMLKQQFPKQISGEVIVARECLVDGPVDGNSLVELFKTRAKFIGSNYVDFTREDYYQITVSEFEKIRQIPKDAEINLWFEDDLFCHVNLWFVCNLLKEYSESSSINLVRPEIHTQFGFGGLNEMELLALYKKRQKLTQVEKLAKLWTLYQQQKSGEMWRIGKHLKNHLPFLLPAIQAHIQRIPSNGNPGRPVKSLVKIKNELQTDDCGDIFKEFTKRESIYGFGYLQVKRIFTELQ